jgi:glutaredoxin-like YruB-family protein
MAKQYLDEHKIKYEDADVASDMKAREEMIQKSKQMGVPVIDIDGKIIVGFDKAKIDKILDIK